jgi:hypothetical protein
VLYGVHCWGCLSNETRDRLLLYCTTENKVLGGEHVRVFIDDDDSFLRWLDTYPHGYVLNTYRNPTAGYVKLHRATCSQLRRHDTRQKQQTRDYRKVCSLAIADVQRWADTQVSGHAALRACGCMQRDSDAAE